MSEFSASPVTPGSGGAGIAEAGPVLRCQDLTKSFGGVAAVLDVSIEVAACGVFGICGYNGAGKSTLFNLLAGSIRGDSGRVWIGDSDVTQLAASKRARMGLARTWQLIHLTDHRTVLDNVAAGCLPKRSQSIVSAVVRPQLAQARARASEVLEQLGLSNLRDQFAGNLTLEGQRLTELARAVASEPRVILLDEPASGLSADQRRALADVISGLGKDLAVVLVEHDIDMLLAISQQIWAMVNGGIAFSGSSAEFEASPVHDGLRGLKGQK